MYIDLESQILQLLNPFMKFQIAYWPPPLKHLLLYENNLLNNTEHKSQEY